MRLKHLYLALCVVGVVAPCSAMVPFVRQHGLDLVELFRQQFSSSATSFFGLDLLVTALVFVVFLLAEGRRQGVRHLWLPLVAMGSVGVSLGLPLFLLLREQALEATGAAP